MVNVGDNGDVAELFWREHSLSLFKEIEDGMSIDERHIKRKI
jgi:hypothetical protein